MHQLIETRRVTDNRKMVRCTTCNQVWTKPPRGFCPGVPVVPWGSEHGVLRTRTQAKKEHYIIPADAKPVAALSGKDEYFWLFDISQCEQRLPTAEQRRRAEQRETTIRERYGCKLCSYRYLGKAAQHFYNGVCWPCSEKAREWNTLVRLARLLVEQDVPIIMLATEPAVRLVRSGGSPKYRITGYQSYRMATGEINAEYPLLCKDDYAPLFGCLEMQRLSGVREPMFLFPTESDQGLFWEALVKHFGPGLRNSIQWGWDTLTAHLPTHQSIPLFPLEAEKDWRPLPDPLYTPQERYFAEVCAALGLPGNEDRSVGVMLWEIVQHLADRDEVALP